MEISLALTFVSGALLVLFLAMAAVCRADHNPIEMPRFIRFGIPFLLLSTSALIVLTSLLWHPPHP